MLFNDSYISGLSFMKRQCVFIFWRDLAENQPTAGVSSLNEYDSKNEYGNGNGMRKSETQLVRCIHHFKYSFTI